LERPKILRISVDGQPDYHSRLRGLDESFDIRGILKAVRDIRHGRNTQLIFTAIPGPEGNINRNQLSFVLSLAREFSILVNVNPAFGVARLSEQEERDLRWSSKQADMQMSRGKRRFLLKGGNNHSNPTCQAARAVVTITADDKVALPCYHRRIVELPIKGNLRAVYETSLWQETAKKNGRYSFCQGCTIWCYIMPSFILHWFDRIVVWEHSLSGFQVARDAVLRTCGRHHLHNPYPNFEL